MSEHDFATIKELLRIFASCDEEERVTILNYAQKLTENPDPSSPAS